MRWYSGLPQLARVALVPVSADNFMNRRRSISIMTSQTIVRCAFLLVTINAEAHRVVDNALRHRHLCNVAMAGGALNVSSNVRGVVETNM